MSTDYKNYKTGMQNVKTVKALLKLLNDEGYTFKRQNGSQGIFRNDTRGISVSVKMNELTRGSLRNILQDIYPLHNIKHQEMKEENQGRRLTESMMELCKELNLDIENLTQEDYNTLEELTS